jgi:hypothetical protein
MRKQVLGLAGSKGILPYHIELDELRLQCENDAVKDALLLTRCRKEGGELTAKINIRSDADKEGGRAAPIDILVNRTLTVQTAARNVDPLSMLEVMHGSTKTGMERMLLHTLDATLSGSPVAADTFL